MVVCGWSDDLARNDGRIAALERLDGLHTLVAVPRYDVFRDVILGLARRSEEHTSELQSLMRISYAVFCLKKKKTAYKINVPLFTIYTDHLNTQIIHYNR